ncbi:MAG: dynamin family protein, partial [Pseudomonadota bacterium]
MVHEAEPDGPVTSLIRSLLRLADRFQDRLELGLDSPLLTAVIGATGTGKSKVFNSLLGAPLSPSGFKRPTTLAPVFLASPQESHLVSRPSFFSEYEKRPAGEGPVSFRTDSPKELIVLALESFEYPGLILIDTPDFDSVLESNRAEARDVFDRAEAVVFVTDAVKYADQASWDYLELIQTRDKEAILVANRIKNPLSLEDFIRRLREAGLDREVLSFPDEPGLNDLDLFSTDYPALVRLREKLKQWSREERQGILLKEAQADWAALESGLTSELLPELAEASAELGRLKQELSAALARTKEGLARSLNVTISGELKSSLVSQIQALFVKWDLLRYPRRLMALPFTLIRDRVLAPLGLVEGRGESRSGLAHEVDRLFEANQETMVAVIHDFNRQATEIFASAEVGKSLADKESFSPLSLSADQVR